MKILDKAVKEAIKDKPNIGRLKRIQRCKYPACGSEVDERHSKRGLCRKHEEWVDFLHWVLSPTTTQAKSGLVIPNQPAPKVRSMLEQLIKGGK